MGEVQGLGLPPAERNCAAVGGPHGGWCRRGCASAAWVRGLAACRPHTVRRGSCSGCRRIAPQWPLCRISIMSENGCRNCKIPRLWTGTAGSGILCKKHRRCDHEHQADTGRTAQKPACGAASEAGNAGWVLWRDHGLPTGCDGKQKTPRCSPFRTCI